MLKPKIINFDEEDQVVCPMCHSPIVDVDEGLVSQPSCPHILFVYANGEAFEFDAAGFEALLEQERERSDEVGDYLDAWEWLSAQCGEGDVILEQVSEDMACGLVSFKVWVGMRRDSESRCHLVRAASKTEFSSQDRGRYFHPTPVFIRWMQAQFKGKLIYDIGAGMGHVSKALAKAGLRVTAIDLEPRSDSEFDVIKADSTTYPFERGAVVMFCRPSHGGFVEKTIAKAIQSHVSHILYVGLRKNLHDDLGSLHDRFAKRRIGMVGHSDERVWELNVGRLRADASIRRGIPRLSSSYLK